MQGKGGGMKRIKDFRLSVKLIAGGLIAVLASICSVGIVAVNISSQSLLSIGLENSERIAMFMAKATQNFLKAELSAAQEMAMVPLVKEAVFQVAEQGTDNSRPILNELNQYFQQVHKKIGQDIDFYFISDRQGNIVADSYGGTMLKKKVSIGDRAYFARARDKGQPVIGKPIKSEGSGENAIVLAVPQTDKSGRFAGIFAIVLKLEAFASQLTDFKVGKTGYPFMVDETGMIIAHPNKDLVFELNVKTLKGMEEITAHMLAGKDGHDTYIYKGVDKQAGYASLPMTGWSIAVTQDLHELWAYVNEIIIYSVVIGLVILVVVAVILYFAARSFAVPVNRAVMELKAMAEGEGDLTRRLPVSSRDEVGILSHTFNVFIEKLQHMITDISKGVHTLSESSAQLATVSEEVANSAASMSERSGSVASAAEEMTTNMNSVSAAMEESTHNITMVANAADQMHATIEAISRNTETAREVAGNAVTTVGESTERMNQLGDAAQAIGQVVETITDISEQVNLLSLNATIEAARAGEAGKGFAVVANEIKELASQTSEASQDIKDKIDNIQKSAQGSMSGMEQVSKIISRVNEIVSEIATAVEQQSSATREISDNITNASSGIDEVNRNVSLSATVAETITKDIDRVNQSSANMADRSLRIETSAEELSELAESLDELVGHFKI